MAGDDSRLKDLIEAAAGAGLAAGGAAAGGGGGAATAGALVLGFVPYVLGLIVPPLADRRKREVLEWWDAVTMDNGHDAAAGVEIAARLAEPGAAAQETIVAALRALQDRLSPAVIPALAMLTREYVRTGRGPDWFFRGVSRMLTDLSAEEFTDLRALVQWTVRSTDQHRFKVFLRRAEGEPESLEIPRKREEDARTRTPPGFRTTHILRLFALLKVNGLAADAPAGRFRDYAGPTVIECDLEVVRRIASLIG